jgi:hypothetical protein
VSADTAVAALALVAILCAVTYLVIYARKQGRLLGRVDREVGELQADQDEDYAKLSARATSLGRIVASQTEGLKQHEELIGLNADEIEVVRLRSEEVHVGLQRDVNEIVEEVKALSRSLDQVRAAPAPAPAPPPPLASGNRLPVIQSVEVAAEQKCKGCKHFNREAWEETLRMNPVFAQAANWVTPNKMAVPVATDKNGDPLPEQPKGPLPIEANKWSTFAVCVKEGSPNYSTALSGEDSCPMWEAA